MAKYKLLKIFTDGGSRGNPGIAGIGVHVLDGDNNPVYDYSGFLGETTNNVAEYEGLFHAITWLNTFKTEHQIENVEIFMDSQLVVEQVKQNWKINQSHLRELAEKVWQELGKLNLNYSIKHVRREQNKVADMLANQAMDKA